MLQFFSPSARAVTFSHYHLASHDAADLKLVSTSYSSSWVYAAIVIGWLDFDFRLLYCLSLLNASPIY